MSRWPLILVILISGGIFLFTGCSSGREGESAEVVPAEEIQVAQTEATGTLRGQLKSVNFDELDWNGESETVKISELNGAEIVFSHLTDSAVYEAESDDGGRFSIESAIPGDYLMTVTHPGHMPLKMDVHIDSINPTEMEVHLVHRIEENRPYTEAEARLKPVRIKLPEETMGREVMILQTETEMMVTGNPSIQTENPLTNSFRYEMEGLLTNVSNRQGMDRNDVLQSLGDLSWLLRYSDHEKQKMHSYAVCSIPIQSPERDSSGKALYTLKTLKGIELNYIDLALQIYKEKGIDFPAFIVGGEFNAESGEVRYNYSEVLDFYDDLVKLVKKHYPGSEVGVSLNNVYKYGAYHIPPYGLEGEWEMKVKNREIMTTTDFIKALAAMGTPMDFISTEIHPGETDPYSLDFLIEYTDSLIEAGGRLYFWEFWFLGGKHRENYTDDFVQTVPGRVLPESGPDGVNEKAQAQLLGGFLDYISGKPDVIGFHYDGQVRDGTPFGNFVAGFPDYISNFGYYRDDGKAKPVLETHLDWLKKNRTVTTIIADKEEITLNAVPGKFRIVYYNDEGRIITNP